MTRPLEPVSTSSGTELPPSTEALTAGSVPSRTVSGIVASAGAGSAAGEAAAAAADSAVDGSAKSIEFRLLSRLSVQLVTSTAAAGSNPASESVSDVRIGWMIGSRRSSKSAFAGAAVTADPVAIAAAARNAPTAPPMTTTRRRRTLALRDWLFPLMPSRPAIRLPSPRSGRAAKSASPLPELGNQRTLTTLCFYQVSLS